MLILLLNNPALYNKNKFINLLSLQDQKIALKFRNKSVRSQFIAGRLLLMECMYRFNKGKLINKKIIFNKNGKPIFSKSAIKFNISHTDKLIACAIGRKDMGIDIEYQKRNISSLADRILDKKHMEKYNTLNPNKRTQYLLKQWVLLEAYSKLTSDGISQIEKYKKHKDFFKFQKVISNHYLAITAYNHEKINICKVNNLTFIQKKIHQE